MAASPAHKFGQMIGVLLEELIEPDLREYCDKRGHYLDTIGPRGAARTGKKISWFDKYGNKHDLDFVIEAGGSASKIGKPVAFIEAAWRRYAKHSKNKAQEIQGALLPIADKHVWDAPFLGAVLAGVFTGPSVEQLKSSGFSVLHIQYDTIVAAFASAKINVSFEEDTPVNVFAKTIEKIEKMGIANRNKVRDFIREKESHRFELFIKELELSIDRMIDKILIVPLYGQGKEFSELGKAIEFISSYEKTSDNSEFRKYEIIVVYTNGDKIDASFSSDDKAVDFLSYISGP